MLCGRSAERFYTRQVKIVLLQVLGSLFIACGCPAALRRGRFSGIGWSPGILLNGLSVRRDNSAGIKRRAKQRVEPPFRRVLRLGASSAFCAECACTAGGAAVRRRYFRGNLFGEIGQRARAFPVHAAWWFRTHWRKIF